MDQELVARAAELLDLCRTKRLKIAAVESCTGGLVAATLTEIAGSSDVFERGFVTYSNAAKETMVGVTPTTLARHGAVSRETAEAMAKGALTHAPVHPEPTVGRALGDGIAGPGGAVPGKPVGLVHFAAASRGGRLVARERNYGDIGRTHVRRASVLEALAVLAELATTETASAG